MHFCGVNETVQAVIHYSLHFIAPAGVAWFVDYKSWKRIYLIFLATMLVDIDHLLATPMFDPNRCSLGFHPLHSYYAIVAYVVLFFFPKPFRYISVGLLMHMATDGLDCIMMNMGH